MTMENASQVVSATSRQKLIPFPAPKSMEASLTWVPDGYLNPPGLQI